MKLLNIVLFILVISSVCASPKSRWMANRGKKIKRGIYGEGFGGGSVHGLNLGLPPAGFGLPFGFHQKPYAASVYSKFIGAPFAFTHGDASVQSFQINYPKYNYVQPKPIIAQPASFPIAAPYPIAAPFTPQVQFAAAQYPQIFQGFAGVAQHVHHAVAPSPGIGLPTQGTPDVSHGHVLPVAAAPTFFIHQKPVVPVAIPAPVVPKPVVFTKPLPQHPIFTIAALTPQFVSIPYPTDTPTENPSTTINTASTTPTDEPLPTNQPNPDGQPGTNFVTNVNPDQQSWQPMFISSTNHFLPTPTTPSAQNVPRPPISLLPPYLGPTGPGYDSNTFFITSTNIPAGHNNNNNNNNHNNNNDNIDPQSNQSENNFNNINPMHNIHNNNNGNEFGQGGFEIPQQTHNINYNNNNNNFNNNNNDHNNHHGSHSHHHNQHRNHHNVNQQGYGPFNGQGYDASSNRGRYIGPSSYQVGLRTRIN